MSVNVLHLYKLIRLLGSSESQLTSLIRSDLRAERDKLLGQAGGGGDFHLPFWTDAKSHAVGRADLLERTEARIESHDGRKRLYPLLAEGFLDWLDQFRRGTNLPISPVLDNVHNHYDVPGIDLTIKVDNLLALKLGEDRRKLVYPYFSEAPVLSAKWARVALWIMSEALAEYDIACMEVLDVLRGVSFSVASFPMKGNEDNVFFDPYEQIRLMWEALKPDYQI